MSKKFYEFKNIAENEYSLYVYGEIVDEKQRNLWTGEVINENDVDIKDFKEALSGVPNGSKLNMYVNSVGGSVFATSAIVTLLQRAKERGIVIDAYIDGIACSCASWLIMIANNINVYKNSVMMIHKPMTYSFGNANDLAKDIEVLNKIENGVIIPMYESKMKCEKKKLIKMIDEGTWLTAEEIQENFNVTFIDEAKDVQNIKSDLFNTFKNTPKEFKKVETSQPKKEEIDYSYYHNILKELGGKK